MYGLLNGVLSNQTVKNYRVDEALEALQKAAKGYGVNEDVFIEILTFTSYPGLRELDAGLRETGGEGAASGLPGVVGAEFARYKQRDVDTYGAFKTICLFGLDPPRAIARLMKKAKSQSLVTALTVLFSDYLKHEVPLRY